MESLRTAIQRLSFYIPENFNKVSACATYLGMNRPISVKTMIPKLNAISVPTSIIVSASESPQYGLRTGSASVKMESSIYIITQAFDQTGICVAGVNIKYSLSDSSVGGLDYLHDITTCPLKTRNTYNKFTGWDDPGVTTIYAQSGFGKETIAGNIIMKVTLIYSTD